MDRSHLINTIFISTRRERGSKDTAPSAELPQHTFFKADHEYARGPPLFLTNESEKLIEQLDVERAAQRRSAEREDVEQMHGVEPSVRRTPLGFSGDLPPEIFRNIPERLMIEEVIESREEIFENSHKIEIQGMPSCRWAVGCLCVHIH